MAAGSGGPSVDVHSRPVESIDDWSTRIDDPGLQDGLRGVLIDAMGALPADDRAALILHDVEDVSKRDIADILGVELAAVTTRLNRARLFEPVTVGYELGERGLTRRET